MAVRMIQCRTYAPTTKERIIPMRGMDVIRSFLGGLGRLAPSAGSRTIMRLFECSRCRSVPLDHHRFWRARGTRNPPPIRTIPSRVGVAHRAATRRRSAFDGSGPQLILARRVRGLPFVPLPDSCQVFGVARAAPVGHRQRLARYRGFPAHPTLSPRGPGARARPAAASRAVARLLTGSGLASAARAAAVGAAAEGERHAAPPPWRRAPGFPRQCFRLTLLRGHFSHCRNSRAILPRIPAGWRTARCALDPVEKVVTGRTAIRCAVPLDA
jgi:hypothetical protein